MSLTVGILGAGSIGCWIGGHLAQSPDCDTILVGRPWLQDAIAEYGLRLTELDGRMTVHRGIQVATEVQALRQCDVVLVAVKGRDTAAAGADLASVIAPGAVVVSCQNGLHNAARLRQVLPGVDVLAGMVSFNVARRADHHLQQATSGPIVTEAHPRLEPLLTAAHQVGLNWWTHTDMAGVQRTKLIFNLNNALNAVVGLPLRTGLLDPQYRRVLALAMDEARAVFAACGDATPRVGRLLPRWTPTVLRLPTWAFTRVAAALIQIDPAARSSMWDDLRKGRPTEIDDLNGEVVRLGQERGVPTPVNAALVSAVQAAEATGTGSPGISPAQLLSQ